MLVDMVAMCELWELPSDISADVRQTLRMTIVQHSTFVRIWTYIKHTKEKRKHVQLHEDIHLFLHPFKRFIPNLSKSWSLTSSKQLFCIDLEVRASLAWGQHSNWSATNDHLTTSEGRVGNVTQAIWKNPPKARSFKLQTKWNVKKMTSYILERLLDHHVVIVICWVLNRHSWTKAAERYKYNATYYQQALHSSNIPSQLAQRWCISSFAPNICQLRKKQISKWLHHARSSRKHHGRTRILFKKEDLFQFRR